MRETLSSDNRRPQIILLAILFVALSLRVAYALASAPVDDAFITFRYARNLAEGAGFVYNPGSRVLGTTTPLFTLILAPGAALGLPLDAVAFAMVLISDLIAVLLLVRIVGRAVGPEAGLLSGFVYALFYTNAAACGYGMEAPILHVLVLASVDAAARGRWSWAAAWAGLASLTRPEGYLASAILGAVWIGELRRGGKRGAWKPVAVFMAILVPWLTFATLYFGSPIPNSILIKARQEGITAREWLDFFFLRNPLLILLWLGVAAGTFVAWRRRSQALLILAGWLLLYTLFFLAGRPAFLGAWYFPPLGGALVALACVGAIEWGGVLLKGRRRAAVALALAWVAASGFVIPRNLESVRWGKRNAEAVHLRMAEWVRENTAPGDTVQVSDIGYVGYYSDRPILDSSSLVSPEVLDFYEEHAGDPDRELELILSERPDLLLVPIYGTNYRRLKDAGLLSYYYPVERFQVSGRRRLDPLDSTAMGYTRSRVHFADFLALRRIERPDTTN